MASTRAPRRRSRNSTPLIGEDVILERCRNALTTQAAGPKMLWLKRNRPEIYARTHKFLNSTSFINFRLTGAYAIDHYSAGNSTPYYLPDRLGWSDELAPGIIPMERMPDLHWTTDIIGGVTAKAAAETGLAAGTPVIAGTIDAAAEAVSVGVTEPGQMMMMYGSTIFIIEITAEKVRDPRSGMRRGCSRASMRRWRASRRRERSPTGSAAWRPRTCRRPMPSAC